VKVLLVNPSRAGQGNIPLNIPLLIGVLRKDGHDVRLFDFSDYAFFDDLTKSYEKIFFKEAQFDSKVIIADRRDHYKDRYGSAVNGIDLKTTDYTEDFDKLLNDFMPDLIAVSCLSVDFGFINNFLLQFKRKYSIPVIFGGIHAILLPEEVLNSQSCDFICIGEGENSLPNLLSAIEHKLPLEMVRGIWFKKSDAIVKNQPELLTDLTTLKMPNYDCFDPVHFYRPFDGKKYKMLNYELSRGCPFSCSYCVNGVLKEKYKDLGKYHRIKTIEQSINELKFLIDKYHFTFIRFWDEDFTSINADFIEQYAERYSREINLPFLIYARVETVSEKKVQILKQMGCRTFAMGIESGNGYIRKKIMNRHMSDEIIIDKFKLVKLYGIRVTAYNIIGLPHENRDFIFDTIELNRKINPDSFSVTMLEPYKGTPIRTMCEEEGLDPLHETVFNKPQFIPKGMTFDELKGLHRTFPLYVRFPKERFYEIRIAESDDQQYYKLLNEFENMKYGLETSHTIKEKKKKKIKINQ
jgi:anaerobic magnesium-protoporphyrin IX monomethyl ester cyclase